MTRYHFHGWMSCSCFRSLRFQLSFAAVYCCWPAGSIWLTTCKLCDHWNPMQPAAIRSRITSSVAHATWQLLIPSWLEANYINISTSYLLSWSFHSPLPQQQVLARKIAQQVERGSELSKQPKALTIVPLAVSQQQCWHQIVHCDAADAATRYMAPDFHEQMGYENRCNQDQQQHEIGCE